MYIHMHACALYTYTCAFTNNSSVPVAPSSLAKRKLNNKQMEKTMLRIITTQTDLRYADVEEN